MFGFGVISPMLSKPIKPHTQKIMITMISRKNRLLISISRFVSLIMSAAASTTSAASPIFLHHFQTAQTINNAKNIITHPKNSKLCPFSAVA